MSRSFITTLICASLLSATTWAQSYMVIDVGPQEDGIWSSLSTLNNLGQGGGEKTTMGFDPKAIIILPTPAYGLSAGIHEVNIPYDPAWSFFNFLSNKGTGAGSAYSQTLGMFGFAWKNGECIVLSDMVSAKCVNNNDLVVGYGGDAETNSLVPMAYDLKRSQLITGGSLGGNFGVAEGINDNDEVVGYSKLEGNSGTHAFYWDIKQTQGGLIDLGTLPNGYSSSAAAINNKGQIAGSSDNGGMSHAVVWEFSPLTNQIIIRDLKYLPGHWYAYANGIDEQGTVVGNSVPLNGYTMGFVAKNYKMVSLDSLLIPADQAKGSIEEALGISKDGKIAAMMRLTNGDLHAVILVPVTDSKTVDTRAVKVPNQAAN